MSKTAPRNAPSASPSDDRLAVDQVLAGEPVDVVAVAGFVELLGRLAEGEQPVADPRDVDLLDRVDQPEQVDPLLRVELPDKPEVEEDDLLRDRVGQDVAGVRVAVEEAVDQDLLDDRPDEHGAELGGVEAGGAELVGLRDLDAVDELHGDDALAGQLVPDERDVDLGEALHPVGEAPGVVRLVAVVELLEDALGELGDDRAQAHLARDREPLLGDAGHLLHDPEVGLRLGQDPRSLDLDGDERPVVEPAPGGPAPSMRPRRAPGRRSAYRASGGEPELLGDDRDHVLVAERRGLALELGQLGDPLGRQDVAPAGHHLADLHVGRPELLEHRPDPRRAARVHEVVCLAEDTPGEPAPDRPDRRVRERDVETGRVDRVVDLLEAEVLDDRVATRGRQAFEEAPDPAAPVGPEVGSVEAEDRIGEGGQARCRGPPRR